MAAGGGGDAVGILLARRILDPGGDGPALIATCAWERLRIDPIPGPRSIDGFTGLGQVDGPVVEVLPTSDTEPPGRSMLPRLAGEADARIFLHDFEGGAKGLAARLRNLAGVLAADRLVVVDVGGDAVATGEEPNLLSPLADSLTLAAALSSGVPTSLAVVGPGTDAELNESEVLDRLRSLGATALGRIVPDDAERYSQLLTWHPTEASAVVAASAFGERGAVEMRRGSQPTPLTAQGSEVWVLKTPQLVDFPLARGIATSGSLAQAVDVIGKLAVNEIEYERAKARQVADRSGGPGIRPLEQVVIEALEAGATHITTRRLLEHTGVRSREDIPDLPGFPGAMTRVGGLWRLP